MYIQVKKRSKWLAYRINRGVDPLRPIMCGYDHRDINIEGYIKNGTLCRRSIIDYDMYV